MAFYLAIKEFWRARGRFLLFSLVIALITMLVLLVAALGTGLADANRQFIDKLDADLLVVQEDNDLVLTTSRLDRQTLNGVRRINGVEAAGLIAFSNGSVLLPAGSEAEDIDVSLVGIEPGQLGAPELLAGQPLRDRYADQVLLDERLAADLAVSIGDRITLRTVQGAEQESFELTVSGITEERAYFFAPSVYLPLYTWEKVRPQAVGGGDGQPIGNLIVVTLTDPSQTELISARVLELVDGVEVADKETLVRAQPGYTAQQTTVEAQRGFALVIGVLVVGGFFQIQTLQKLPQIGMLKAIGIANRTVALSTLAQIVIVTAVGVALGTAVTLLMALGIPPVVPLRFTPPNMLAAIAALMLIGPIGGMVSVRLAVRIEPLSAIAQGK
ncbi:MAG: ABC transporter permease [Anaerolineae bacterium]|nr:MAG: ABC transporter permease [Anaerolineae bacterium]